MMLIEVKTWYDFTNAVGPKIYIFEMLADGVNLPCKIIATILIPYYNVGQCLFPPLGQIQYIPPLYFIK